MDGSVFSGLWLEASLVGALILLNGFFAASEIAMISARRSRLQQLAAPSGSSA
jgi:putative hemolysin